MSTFNEGHLAEVTIDNDAFLAAEVWKDSGEKRVKVGDVMNID